MKTHQMRANGIQYFSMSAVAMALMSAPASAEVSISGFGRFGVTYSETKEEIDQEDSTFVQSRLRLEFDAQTQTESGLTFGATTWVQGDHDSPSWGFSPAKFYVEYEDWTLQLGNVLPAFDGAHLLKQTRLGVHAVSLGGDPLGEFFQLAYRGYGRLPNRDGVALGYGSKDFDVQISAVDPDRTDTNSSDDLATEVAFSVFYRINDLELSFATAQNGGGIKGNDLYFVGSRYKVGDAMRIGLNVNENGDPALGTSYTLYGDYKFDDFVFNYYVSHNSGEWSDKVTDMSYGVALRYDLDLGVFLATSIQRDFAGMTLADLGVRFDF